MRLALMLVLGGSVSCTPPSEPSTDGVVDSDEVVDVLGSLEDVHLTVSDVVYSVVYVAWESEVSGISWVEYGLDDQLDLISPTSEASQTEHTHTLLGLKAGRSYSIRAVVETAEGLRYESEPQSVHLDAPPQGIGPFVVTDLDPTQSQSHEGFFLTSLIQVNASWVVILDGDADVVWWTKMEPGLIVVTTKPSLDGKSVLWGRYDMKKVEDVGVIVRMRLDATEVTETRTLLGHHAFIEHGDGTFGWLALDFRDVLVDGEMRRLAADRIFEGPEGAVEGDEPTEIFNYFDDYHPVEFTCSHMEEPFDRYGEFDIQEWTHSNSLVYLESEDAYLALSRHTDGLVKIDGETGEVLWQINGAHGDFTTPSQGELWPNADDTIAWSHGHMSHLWEGGFMVFDNGVHHTPLVSGISEYEWDEEAMTLTQVWDYKDPDGRWTTLMGDARKLDGGNYLAGWSQLGMITEVTPEQEIVWRVEAELGNVFGRVTWFDNIYDLGMR